MPDDPHGYNAGLRGFVKFIGWCLAAAVIALVIVLTTP